MLMYDDGGGDDDGSVDDDDDDDDACPILGKHCLVHQARNYDARLGMESGFVYHIDLIELAQGQADQVRNYDATCVMVSGSCILRCCMSLPNLRQPSMIHHARN